MRENYRAIFKTVFTLICVAYLAPLAHARVDSVKLGITTNCPYGLAG